MKYSTAFRNNVLKKVIPPESRSVVEVSKTIYGWLKQAEEGSIDERKDRKKPGDRSLSEKLTLVMESKGKTPEEQGEWQLSQGLYTNNGASMKGTTLLFTLYRLGVLPSFSRPRVSDDNAFI